MSVSVKANQLVIVKQSHSKLEIRCGDACMVLYEWHKVRELIFQIYKLHEEESGVDNTEPKCHIEIITTGNQSFVIQYPYNLRDFALRSYSILVEALKEKMENLTQTE